MPAKRKKTPPPERPHERFYRFRDAAYTDRAEAARLLAADPTLLDARNGIGETALHFLAIEDCTEAVAWLIECGADVNTRNDFGETPLWEAASVGHLDMCRLLLAHGADPRARKEDGDTALADLADSLDSPVGDAARKRAAFDLLFSLVGPDEDINDYFSPLTAYMTLKKAHPVAALLAARGLRDAWSESDADDDEQGTP